MEQNVHLNCLLGLRCGTTAATRLANSAWRLECLPRPWPWRLRGVSESLALLASELSQQVERGHLACAE